MTDLMASQQCFPQGVLSLAFAFLISKNNPEGEAAASATAAAAAAAARTSEARFSASPEASTTDTQSGLPAAYEEHLPEEYLQYINMTSLEQDVYLAPYLQRLGVDLHTIVNSSCDRQDSQTSPDYCSSYGGSSEWSSYWPSEWSDYLSSSSYEKNFLNTVELSPTEFFSCDASSDASYTQSPSHSTSESLCYQYMSSDDSPSARTTDSGVHVKTEPEGLENFDHQQHLKKLPALFDVRVQQVVSTGSSVGAELSLPPKKQVLASASFPNLTNSKNVVPKDPAQSKLNVVEKYEATLLPQRHSYVQERDLVESPACERDAFSRKKVFSDEEEFLLSLVGRSGDEIAALNNPEFHQLIQHITPEHLQKLKDLRRRYKNKRAARNCRAKRAMTFENMKLQLNSLQDLYMERMNVYNFLLQMKQTNNCVKQL